MQSIGSKLYNSTYALTHAYIDYIYLCVCVCVLVYAHLRKSNDSVSGKRVRYMTDASQCILGSYLFKLMLLCVCVWVRVSTRLLACVCAACAGGLPMPVYSRIKIN